MTNQLEQSSLGGWFGNGMGRNVVDDLTAPTSSDPGRTAGQRGPIRCVVGALRSVVCGASSTPAHRGGGQRWLDHVVRPFVGQLSDDGATGPAPVDRNYRGTLHLPVTMCDTGYGLQARTFRVQP